MSETIVYKKNAEHKAFMASLRRLRDNADFLIVLSKIDSLGNFRKDLKADDPIVLARLSGKQVVPNYLHDHLDKIDRGEKE